MISYLFGIYCIDETVVRRSAGFWTIIAQFSTCHNLTAAAAYWLFSLVDPYPALLAYFLMQFYILKTLFYVAIVRHFRCTFSNIQLFLPVHSFIFNDISFNDQ